MERTIRKNSKEFTAALKGARNVRVYSLDNGFRGAPVAEFPRWVDDFALYAGAAGYKARVHSNLWVEFEGAL
jgi:hypothetical protein